MGDLLSSIENELTDIIKDDNSEHLKNIIIKNNINKNILLGPQKRTLVQLCSYFGSSKCLEELINMNFDINELETSNNNSPLFTACKFDFLEIVCMLLNNKTQKCLIMRKNNEGLNEFEVAFLRGNYNICYYLLYEYKSSDNAKNNNDNSILNINPKNENINSKETQENEYLIFFNDNHFTLEKYLSMQEYLFYPLFNMPLFYKSLKQKIVPGKCPSFAAERKKTKDLLTKIPDPNESWGHFIKRLIRLELYNPPLVDKTSVRKVNSLYMDTQMKLISSEYGISMDYVDSKDLKKDNNIMKDNEEKKPLNIIIDVEDKKDDNNNNDHHEDEDEITHVVQNNNQLDMQSSLSKSSIDSYERLNKKKNNTVKYIAQNLEKLKITKYEKDNDI